VTDVPRIRSALFVPAARADFLARAAERGADAVILDLEDGVIDSARGRARALAATWISARPRSIDPVVCVRINGSAAGCLDDDLAAVVQANLTAVVVPKVTSASELTRVADALSWHEGRAGLARGHTRIWPLVETAEAVVAAAEIARASGRVAYMGGGTSRQGDLAESLGFVWSPDGQETLYVRSKVLVDVRAAGVANPVTGLVSILDDLAPTRTFATQSRALGYEGMMCIHPSQVPIANAVFGVSEEGQEDSDAIREALADAERRGEAVITHGGRMYEVAHPPRLIEEAR
jgi:citrate lyase subunit beta/citryl-CoA lyase